MQQSRGLLWVKGKPGSGKSTLMAFITRAFQHLPAQRTQVNLSFFFHGRGTSLQKSSQGMFRTLLYQLYRLSACARSVMVDAFKEKAGFGGIGNWWEWHASELQNMFSRAVKEVARMREVTIFIDALDEAGSNTAAELVNYFHQLNDDIAVDRGSFTKICISCRHYPVVARNLGLEILVEEENRRDIQSFVHWRLEEEVGLQPDDPLFIEKRQGLRNTIVDKAGDNFLWVSMMMPRVIDMLKDGEAYEDVSQMVADQSSELFAFYKDILTSIKSCNLGRTLLLMQWVCFAERALSVTELRFALACDDVVVRPDQERCADSKGFVESDGRMRMLINSLSGGLIETRQYGTKVVVQVCHQTVNDFLTSGGLQSLSSLAGIENLNSNDVVGRSQDRLSHCCVNYLKLQEVLRADCSWEEEIVHDLPFISYATKNWPVHAAKAEANGEPQDCIIDQFQNEPDLLDTWVKISWAIDLEGRPDPGSCLIHIACAWNLRSAVEALLESGNSMEQRTKYGNRPLHFAARCGYGELVTLLLEAKADIEATNSSGSTPLEHAAANQHENIVKMLLKFGAVVNGLTGYSGTALQSACKTGNISLVRMLIASGADINAKAGENGNALQAAAVNGHEAVVQLLLDKGVDVNVVGGFWGTALQAATLCRRDHSGTIVRMLLRNGADVNIRGGRHDNALQAAATGFEDEAEILVRILLDGGAEVNFSGGEDGSALQAAALRGNEIVVRLLLERGADVNMAGGIYGNALQAAAVSGDAQLVVLLLKAGANIHAIGGMYGNALQGAAYRGSRVVIKLLLDHGADINAEGGKCGSALQAAALQASGSVMQFLIDRGAKVNTQIGEHGNVLVAAANWGRREDILQLLLDNGADVNAQGRGTFGRSLHAACFGTGPNGCKVAAVKFLLDHGADVNVQSGFYGSTLEIARRFSNKEVVKLLLEYGAVAVTDA